MKTHLKKNTTNKKERGRGKRKRKRDICPPGNVKKLNEKLEFKLHILKPGHNLQCGRDAVRSKRVSGGR